MTYIQRGKSTVKCYFADMIKDRLSKKGSFMSEKIGSSGRIAKAAGFIMASMVISRILGYIRDVVIYTRFGQNFQTDAYNAAFSIPDFLYYLLVGGALSSAFIPVFSSYIAKNEEEEGWKVAATFFNLVLLMMGIGIGLGLIFTPSLINLLVPGFSAEAKELTVLLTRVMFIQSLFMAINGISQGILHSYKHFFSPALGSVLYNTAIIVAGWILSIKLGILGFSIGVVFGALLNFSVQIPALVKIGIKYKPLVDLNHPGVKKIMILLLPVLIGLSVNHFNHFVDQYLASTLSEGLVSALRAGQRLMQLPVGIFAISVALAFFPTLTEHAARDEKKEFRDTLSRGIRTVLFLTFPSAIGLIILREPLVRAMYEQGAFSTANTQATAYALLFYCLGLVAYSEQQILNRAFYSLQDTKTPVIMGIIGIGTNIVFNLLLIEPMGHGGLALASSIAGIVNMSLLLYYLKKKVGLIDGRNIFRSLAKIVAASLIMGIVVFLTAYFIEVRFDLTVKLWQILQVAISTILGGVVYLGLSKGLKLEEARLVGAIFTRKIRKRKT